MRIPFSSLRFHEKQRSKKGASAVFVDVRNKSIVTVPECITAIEIFEPEYCQLEPVACANLYKQLSKIDTNGAFGYAETCADFLISQTLYQ